MDRKTRLFTELYNNYYSLIFCTIQAHISNSDLAKDICQEVFIRFYEKFDEVVNPRNWLYGTTRLVTMEFLRKNNLTTLDETSQIQPQDHNETAQLLHDALESITGDDESGRILFELVAVYDFSYKAAGCQLGLTEHQTRYKYNLMVKKVLAYFKNKGIHSLEELL